MLVDEDWDTLLKRIRQGKCTPFLGAGASAGVLSVGSEVAERWSTEYGYPLEDQNDLARVAQYVAVDRDDAMYPKEKIAEEIEDEDPPDFGAADEPHGVLADLPLPVYMTTNYDDFMVQALRSRLRDPNPEICKWNKSPAVRDAPSVFDNDPHYEPSVANPVVLHLHGTVAVPESMVLTEDDYLDFLVAMTRSESKVLPLYAEKALANTSLLFLGYRLADWNFRVIHRALVMQGDPSLRRLSVTVQLPPNPEAQAYLSSYFRAMKVRVFWGDAREFARELRRRWRIHTDAAGDGE